MKWLRLILLITLLSSCSEESTWPREKFDSRLWKSTALGERHRFALDLIASKTLIGKTKPEVLALLGDSSPSEADRLNYVIKLGGYGFDQVFALGVRFERETVREVFIFGD